MEIPVLILGAGYTGSRVAAILKEKGHPVTATSGRPHTFVEWRNAPPGAAVLYSIPPDEWEAERFQLLAAIAPARVVYLSSTGVYGGNRDVDESTPPAPRTARERARIVAEQRTTAGPWSSLVLRPAAIYGPGRGVHTSLQEGTFKLWGDGSNYVSRIHVDDLAALAAAALVSNQTGAWPVSDEQPSQSIEMVRFCCNLLNLPVPPPAPDEALSETRRANRRVDGRAIARRLGVTLRYPSFRVGIPACLSAETLLANRHPPE